MTEVLQTTEMLKLRAITLSDIPEIARLANNYNIWLNLTDDFPHPYTEENARFFLEICKNQEKTYNLAIEFSGKLAGIIGVNFMSGIRTKTGDFGYWLGEEYWGCGIATASARIFSAQIFERFPVERLQASVFAWNLASMRVLEKSGFKRESIAQKAVYKNGIFTDEHIFVKLR